VSLEKIKSEWPGVIEAVKAQRIHLGSFLNEGYPVAVSDGILKVAFAKCNSFHVNTINQSIREIQKIILEHTGFQLLLECFVHDDDDFPEALVEMKRDSVANMETSPDAEPGVVEELQPDEMDDSVDETDFMDIPMIRQIVEMFDGELVAQKPADDK